MYLTVRIDNSFSWFNILSSTKIMRIISEVNMDTQMLTFSLEGNEITHDIFWQTDQLCNSAIVDERTLGQTLKESNNLCKDRLQILEDSLKIDICTKYLSALKRLRLFISL